MIKQFVFALFAAITSAAIIATPASVPFSAIDKSNAFITALANKDVTALSALMDNLITYKMPFSFSGDQNPAKVISGKANFVAYYNAMFPSLQSLQFITPISTLAEDTKTVFIQALGQSVLTSGLTYNNMYVIRFDWNDLGLLVNYLEYSNPITYCQKFVDAACPDGLGPN